jgi:hypothetical protein
LGSGSGSGFRVRVRISGSEFEFGFRVRVWGLEKYAECNMDPSKWPNIVSHKDKEKDKSKDLPINIFKSSASIVTARHAAGQLQYKELASDIPYRHRH